MSLSIFWGGGQSCWFYGDIVFRDVIQIHLTYFKTGCSG